MAVDAVHRLPTSRFVVTDSLCVVPVAAGNSFVVMLDGISSEVLPVVRIDAPRAVVDPCEGTETCFVHEEEEVDVLHVVVDELPFHLELRVSITAVPSIATLAQRVGKVVAELEPVL